MKYTDLVPSDELLTSIIEAHGDLERFARVKEIHVSFNFSGWLLYLKKMGGHIRVPKYIVYPRGEPRTEVTDLLDPDSGNRGLFTAQQVSVVAPDGTVLQQRDNPRDAYEGHDRTTPWDDLHLLYFLSYAMWNYISIPWLLRRPGFEVLELEEHAEAGQTWRVLQVTCPDGFPAHTKVQRWYFGAHDFLLKRMDYFTDTARGTAAHYVFDYREVGGLLFPTFRRVVRRDEESGRVFSSGQSGFLLQYTELVVVDEDGTKHEEDKWLNAY